MNVDRVDDTRCAVLGGRLLISLLLGPSDDDVAFIVATVKTRPGASVHARTRVDHVSDGVLTHWSVGYISHVAALLT